MFITNLRKRIAMDKPVVFAKEPAVLELETDMQKTIVFVTHDINEALRLGDRIAVMHKGNLEQIGSSQELLLQPASQFVKNLFTMHKKQQGFVESWG